MSTAGLALFAAPYAWLVFLAVDRAGGGGWLPALLRRHWLTDLGKYSYGIYILHFPLVGQFYIVGAWFNATFLVLSPLSPLWTIPAGTAVSYVAARISWALIERPFLAMKERFAPLLYHEK